MKTLFFLSSLFFLASCNSSGNSNYSPTSSYEDTKMSLEEKEKLNPTDFLVVQGTYRHNLIGQWVLEGTVANTATLAKYKDITIKIIYYSKTNTEIGSEQKTMFEYFKPNTKQNFKIKTSGYQGTNSIGFEVISASAVD